jgi:hypothetical protein
VGVENQRAQRYIYLTTRRWNAFDHGFENFELYLVDAKGEKEPVRVTHTEGFDGLPVFSPDGKTLSWTSNRTPSKQSQIFLAGWNHEAALATLEKSGATPATTTAAPEKPTEAVSVATLATKPAIDVADLRAHLEYLASPDLKGRLTGTPGEIAATAHVAEHFKKWGLEPGGDNDSYFQTFEFTAGVAVGKDNAMTLNLGGETKKPGRGFTKRSILLTSLEEEPARRSRSSRLMLWRAMKAGSFGWRRPSPI